MKNLTKYITATLATLLLAIIVISTPTYAATTVPVECDGIDDQVKIEDALANDTIINIQGDCVFTGPIHIQDIQNLVIEWNGNTITYSGEPGGGFSGFIWILNSNVTVNDMSIVLDPAYPDDSVAFVVGEGGDLYVNNVIVDGFSSAVLLYRQEGYINKVTATGLVMINSRSMAGLAMGVVILNESQDNVVNWISGRSDAEYAVYLATSLIANNNIAINGLALGEEDFDMLDENVYLTAAPINHLVNCGFPVGSEWDICPDTGNGTEEPDGGDNGNEIEAPGTGIFRGGFVSLSIIMTGISVVTGGLIAVKKFAK